MFQLADQRDTIPAYTEGQGPQNADNTGGLSADADVESTSPDEEAGRVSDRYFVDRSEVSLSPGASVVQGQGRSIEVFAKIYL